MPEIHDAEAEGLEIALLELRQPEADFFRQLRDHPDFQCAAGKMQMTVHFRDEKLGGWNRTRNEWYVSKVFVEDHGCASVVERHGFRRIEIASGHTYWARSGAGSLAAFGAFIGDVTATAMPLGRDPADPIVDLSHLTPDAASSATDMVKGSTANSDGEKVSEFLLTWKPEHWPIANVERLISELENTGQAIEPWRVAAHTKARPGDRVWLLKQGKSRGIFGTGRIVGGKVDVEVGGGFQPGFPIAFDRLVHPDEGFLIDGVRLAQILEGSQLASQSSGTQLRAGQPELLNDALAEDEWSEHVRDYDSALDRVVKTTLNTVAGSNGQEALRTVKAKTLGFPGGRVELRAYVKGLLAKQAGRCALTGLEMARDDEGADEALLLSLDRIDSDMGYDPGNLQLVCRFANMWKSDAEDGEFRRLISLVRLGADITAEGA